MRANTVFAVVLPLALITGACTKRSATSPVAPVVLGGEVFIRDGAWISDRDQLDRAVAAAGRHPLVRAALAEYGAARLEAASEYAIRAAGTTTTGLPVEFTTLPFISDEDPTHGVFVTIGAVGDQVVSQRSELIAGRAPRGDEPGFAPLSIPGGVVWVREADAVGQPAGALGAPAKFNKLKFLSCLVENGPPACDAGAAIAGQIAPAVPHARAIGCAVGVAGAALSCFASNGSAKG